MAAGDTVPVQGEVATQEAVTILTSKILVVELMVHLVPVPVGGTNALPSLYESTTSTIVETGSGSTLLIPTAVTDIMEELAL